MTLILYAFHLQMGAGGEAAAASVYQRRILVLSSRSGAVPILTRVLID
jgi:hypothetical protein